VNPFSIYLHIPYCDSKCPYCDFNSYAVKRWPEAAYKNALIAELRSAATVACWRERSIRTVFFGGGTPSLFAPDSIGALVDVIFELWPTDSSASIEVTMEANPGTVDAAKLAGFRAVGVNRISFGVQSFQPHHLARLGRIHGAEQAMRAIEDARAGGFANVNLDLMFAVPEQTPQEWQSDLSTAISLQTDHISAYNLTFEEGTPFEALRRKGGLRPLSEEMEVAMFTGAREILGAAGYSQYEISNYALPGRECRHNLNYWSGGDYLGVGAGAHSFCRTPHPGVRWSNEKTPGAYLDRVTRSGTARVFEEHLDDRQAQGECVFLALRCQEGLHDETFRKRFGVAFLTAFPHAVSLEQEGILRHRDDRWQLSERGLLVADSVFETFL
jgi:oxygen-independent coproporphyrinogen-3 oxidase